METTLGCLIVLLVGFVIWSAVTRRGVKQVLLWSGLGLLVSVVATGVVMQLLPPPPAVQEQLGIPPEQQQQPSSLLVNFIQYSGHLLIWLGFSGIGMIRQLRQSAAKISAEASEIQADAS